MKRRQFVSTGCVTLVGLAGCSSSEPSTTGPEGSDGFASGDAAVADLPTARINMTEIADASLPPRVLYSPWEDDGPHPRVQLLERILDSPTTVEGTRPPLPEDEHIYYDGVVYQLSHEVIEQTPATRYSVKLDIVQGSVKDIEAIRFANLPEVDRNMFDQRGLATGEVIGIGTTVLYTENEAERSVLVPDSEYSYIVWQHGAEAEWVVDGAADTAINTYEYTAQHVATASEYGRQMRDRFAFEVSNLSDAQQAIVETELGEGEYSLGPDESPPPEFVSFVDRFRGHDHPRGLIDDGRGGLDGNYLVRYHDTVYWTTLAFDENEFETETRTS